MKLVYCKMLDNSSLANLRQSGLIIELVQNYTSASRGSLLIVLRQFDGELII